MPVREVTTITKCQGWISIVQKSYSILPNFCYADNTVSYKGLEILTCPVLLLLSYFQIWADKIFDLP